MTSLMLVQNALSGTIPSEIQGLTALREYYTHTRVIFCALVLFPHVDGWMLTLFYFLLLLFLTGELDLSRNVFITGAIPSTVGELGSLTTIDLNLNSMGFDFTLANPVPVDDAVPTELGRLVNLQSLVVSQNFFVSPLQPMIDMLSPTLQRLDIGTNFFQGAIPASIGTMTNMREYYILLSCFMCVWL